MKIRQVGAKLFNANGRTDVTKLIVAFRDTRTRLKISYKRLKLFNFLNTVPLKQPERKVGPLCNFVGYQEKYTFTV